MARRQGADAGGDVTDDVVLMSGADGGIQFYPRTTFRHERYRGRGLRTPQEGDAWQGYDGKTPNPLDAKHPPACGLKMTAHPWIWGVDDLTVGGGYGATEG